jgi:hypothetical protein
MKQTAGEDARLDLHLHQGWITNSFSEGWKQALLWAEKLEKLEKLEEKP